MIDWVKKLVTGKIAQSMIRKLMVFASGWLVAIGVDAGVVEQFASSTTSVLVAVVLYLISQGWSLVEKRKDGA